jgi:hypothetical protein
VPSAGLLHAAQFAPCFFGEFVMIRTHCLIAALFLLGGGAAAQALEIAEVAHEIALKEMKPAEWSSYVATHRRKYQTWSESNNDGSIKRYLDDKLVEIAPGALKGNVNALKKLVFWVALYKEFDEPPHRQLDEVAATHEKELEDLLKDFSWEKAAASIKAHGSKVAIKK